MKEQSISLATKANKSGLYDYILNPTEFFQNLNRSPKFLLPLLLLILSNTIFATVVSDIHFSSFQSHDIPDVVNVDELVDSNKLILLSVTTFISVAGQLLVTLGLSLFFYLVFNMFVFSNKIKYRNVFSLILYTKIPGFIYAVLLSIYIIFTNDIVGLINPDPTLTESIKKVINPFNVWELILFGIAIHILTKFSKRNAFIIVFVFAIAGVVIEQLI